MNMYLSVFISYKTLHSCKCIRDALYYLRCEIVLAQAHRRTMPQI